MSEAKSQFMLGGYKETNYVGDSLNTMVADFRGGGTPADKARLENMAGYVAANPDKTNAAQFGAYVAKLTGSASGEAKQPVVVSRAKPGSGNGMM